MSDIPAEELREACESLDHATYEMLAAELRNNGYHVVTNNRVRKLTVSHAASLDTLAYFRNVERFEDIVKGDLSRSLAREIVQGNSADCVLWSDKDDEFNKVFSARVCLIVP